MKHEMADVQMAAEEKTNALELKMSNVEEEDARLQQENVQIWTAIKEMQRVSGALVRRALPPTPERTKPP